MPDLTTTNNDQIAKKVGDFIDQNSIKLIYPDQVNLIEQHLNQRWQKLDEKTLDVEEKKLTKILQNRQKAASAHNAIIKREIEVQKYDLGQITDQLTEVPKPSQDYRDHLFDEHILTKNEVITQDQNFFSLVNKGRDPSSEELKAAQQQKVSNRELRKSAQLASSTLINIPKYLGRGLIYDSKVNDDGRYQKYLETRSSLLTLLRSKLGTKNHQIKELIDKFETACDDKSAAFGENDLLALQKQVIEEIAKIEKLNEEELKAVRTNIDKLNQDTKDQLQKFIADEDSNWPYVALQIALLVTPLAGLSFLPFAAGIFEPLLREDLTFGQAVGAVIGNIPGFGPLFHLMKLDYAVGWLLDNCPVVNGATKVIHEVTANIFTNTAFDLIAPTLATELVGIGAAGAYYGYVLDPKINIRDSKGNFVKTKSDLHQEFVKNQETLTKETIEEFKEKGIKIGDKNSKELREELLKNTENNLLSKARNAQFGKVIKMIVELENTSPDHLEEILSPINLDAKPLFESIKSDKIKTLKSLEEKPEMLNQIAERFLAYDYYNKDIKQFKNNQDNIETIVNKHKKILKEKIGATLGEKEDLANFIYCGDKNFLEAVFDGIAINYETPDGKNSNKTIADLKKDSDFSKPSQILNFISSVDKETVKLLVKKMNENQIPQTSLRTTGEESKPLRNNSRQSAVSVC